MKMIFILLLVSTFAARASAAETTTWQEKLTSRMQELEARYPGQVGVFVKDLETGAEFSHRGDETWYVASGVKVPIALEVLKQVDAGKIHLDQEIEIKESDFIDGAGETNLQKPGSFVTVRFLVEQMLIHSDNTASDLLIRLAGLSNINRCLTEVVPAAFTEITSLSDVRRLAFSHFHPAAARMSNQEIRKIRSIHNERSRIQELAATLKLKLRNLRCKTQDEAFSAYYDQKMNSATLRGYSKLLQAINDSTLLKPATHRFFIETMSRAETGRQRVVAGLPKKFVFAHKTGTQHARVCDFGIAWDPSSSSNKKIVIATCARGILSLKKSELALKSIGQAVYQSGVFEDNS